MNVTSSILIAHVRESPDIAQPHCIAKAGQDELSRVGPVASPAIFLLLCERVWQLDL